MEKTKVSKLLRLWSNLVVPVFTINKVRLTLYIVTFKTKKLSNLDESLDVDPNYDPSDFLKLPGSIQINHDIRLVKQERHDHEMQQYDMQQEELQYDQQEYQQQDYQQMDGVNINIEVIPS